MTRNWKTQQESRPDKPNYIRVLKFELSHIRYDFHASSRSRVDLRKPGSWVLLYVDCNHDDFSGSIWRMKKQLCESSITNCITPSPRIIDIFASHDIESTLVDLFDSDQIKQGELTSRSPMPRQTLAGVLIISAEASRALKNKSSKLVHAIAASIDTDVEKIMILSLMDTDQDCDF